MTAMRAMGALGRAAERLEHVRALDPVGRWAKAAVQRFVPAQARDVLHGVPLGHPVHPVLVQLPIGAWTSAAVLDLTGQERAARLLIATGLAGAVPAAVAGDVDLASLHPAQKRVGVVHAAATTAASALYAASLVSRFRGRTCRGRFLAFGGLAAATAGGLLGGHLAYRQASGANHAEAVPYLVESGWHDLGPLAELPAGHLHRRMAGEIPVLVADTPRGIAVLADRCSHLAGPLSQGTAGDDCVTCPWHGSTFRLFDGQVVSGPATAPQPAFETRVRSGRLEARLPAPS